MGVPPVLSERAGRPSHKNYQIVSYLILIPYIVSGCIGIIKTVNNHLRLQPELILPLVILVFLKP